MSNVSVNSGKPDALESRKVVQSMETTEDKPVFQPNCDIFETEKAVIVIADMPGVLKDKLDIQLDDDQLVITGIQDKPSCECLKLVHEGCPAGIFRRTFTILADVVEEGIKATLTDGVLRIEIPKPEKPEPRKIKVEVA